MNPARIMCRRWRGKRNGFTLVELLVVIAVLAILASLLLPALSKSMQAAPRLECASRQKQIAVAFQVYSEDNGGFAPREGYNPFGTVSLNNWSQVLGRPSPGGGYDTDDIWYNALPPYLHAPPATAYFHPDERRRFYERRNIIQCPSAQFPEHARRISYQFALFSVAMNSKLIQPGEGPRIPLNRIEQGDTTRLVLFMENLLEGEKPVHSHQEKKNLGQPSAYANRFSPRHGKGGNLVFADGHVSWFPGYKVVETNESSALKGGPIVPPREIQWSINP
jgi:prepilin-type N-terminal cleavage/methylation domain-containing protein/prepilin-type processing-associated H-X9-DG protein